MFDLVYKIGPQRLHMHRAHMYTPVYQCEMHSVKS